MLVLGNSIHFHQQSRNVWVRRSSVIADLSCLLLVHKHLFVSMSTSHFIPVYYAVKYPNLWECQAPKMEAACFSERSVTIDQMTWCSFSQDLDFDQYCCENLISHSVYCFLIEYKIRSWAAGCEDNFCVSYWLLELLLTAWCHVYRTRTAGPQETYFIY